MRWLLFAAGLLATALQAAGQVAAQDMAPESRRSGYEQMGRETRAMQDEDNANPATLWVLDGEAAWKRKAGTANRACADCHGDAATTMKGVAARHPAPDAKTGKLVNLEQRINACRVEQQQAKPLAYESRELLALTAYVGRQSRGMPIEASVTPATRPALDAGRALFRRKVGQIDMSCAQCHDENWARTSPATSSRRRTPPATPSTGWSGKGSGRCTAGCATACRGCGRNPTSPAQKSTSNSSTTSCGVRAG